MIRYLKIMGLALMSALALSAMASAASAQAANGLITSTGKVTLTGTEIAGKANALTAFGLSFKCPGTTYTVHKYNVTPHTFMPSGAETGTISPQFKEPCASNVGPSTVQMNGCDFVSHLGETTGVADTYASTWDLVCPAGKDVTVPTWFSEAEHNENKEACTHHIPPQSGIKGGTVTDTTEGDLLIGGPLKGIKIVQTKDGLHSLLCPAKEGEAEFDINVTLKGDNEAGANTAISLSHL